MTVVANWYARERAALRPMAGSLMLGGIVYGRTFLGLLTGYSLPSMLAKANREALKDAVLAFYTDRESCADLLLMLGAARINATVRVIPDDVMASPKFWPRLSAAQGLLCILAARSGMPFHMLMPDQVYSEGYFPRLMALGARHRRIAHNGLNVQLEAGKELDAYTRGDALTISARDLTDISWPRLHWRMSPFVMNTAGVPERMPNCHYQVWRARDRVMLFSPHNNTAYMDAATCAKLDTAEPTENTLDAISQRLFGTDYYTPTLDDDMAFIGLEYSDPSAHPQDGFHVGMGEFLRRCREHAPDSLLCYCAKPSEMPASIDDAAPTAAEIRAFQHGLVEKMQAMAA